MSKRRKSVSLDPDLADQIDELDHEFSPLVNKWAREYIEEGQRPVMNRHHIETLIAQLDAQQTAFNEFADAMNDQFDRYRDLLESTLGEQGAVDDIDEAFEEAYERHSERYQEERLVGGGRRKTYEVDNSTPRDPQNLAIREEAKKLGVSPDRLVYELEKRDVRDGHAEEVETHPPNLTEVGDR